MKRLLELLQFDLFDLHMDFLVNGFPYQRNTTTNNHLFFDVTFVSWKPEMFIDLFEDLAFQEKVLTYALAVRDENKELSLNHSKQFPVEEVLLKKLQFFLESEYGSDVIVKKIKTYRIIR